MGNFGFGEMAVIAIFGLLVFGPQKLPEIARSVGGFIREFKSVTNGITSDFKEELSNASSQAGPTPPRVQPGKEQEPGREPAPGSDEVPAAPDGASTCAPDGTVA